MAEVDHPDTGTPVRPRYEYTYNERGNLLTIRDNVYQTAAGIFYDHDGTAGDFSQSYDTRVTEFTYDAQGRQTSRTLPLGVATPGDDTDFVEEMHYDDLGRMTYQVSFEGVVTAYVYDDADGSVAGESGRLVAKHYYGGSTAEDDYLTDVGDGTLTASDETASYTYDARGRRTEVTQALTTHTRVTRNVYDDRGRLLVVAADVDGDGDLDQQLQYDYDPVNGRIERTSSDDQYERIVGVTDLNLGIAARDQAQGAGYIMYSEANVQTRFAANPPSSDNSSHFVAVTYEAGVWYSAL